jgi:hypothetical protein
MQMFAWIKLRWRKAFLAPGAKLIGMFELRRPDALHGRASLRRRGGPERLIQRNSLAFPVYFIEGLALGRRVRLLIRDEWDAFLLCFNSPAKQSQQHAVQALLKT